MSTQLEYCETYVRLKKEFLSPLESEVCSNDQADFATKGCDVDLACCSDLACCTDWGCCNNWGCCSKDR